jgi:DNA-binding response OmpR family regulator
MSLSILDQKEFVIVDANPDDYYGLIPVIERHGAVPCFLTTGDDALKKATKSSSVCWMINLELPDMSGLELHELLRQRLIDSTVFMVADDYQPQAEVVVLCTGGAQFACKPLHPTWLQESVEWNDAQHASAGRQRRGYTSRRLRVSGLAS